jgi:hypothetical protein
MRSKTRVADEGNRSVHLFGMPAHLKSLSGNALSMLEDAAQAHERSRLGTVRILRDAAAFDFIPQSLGTYGDGG